MRNNTLDAVRLLASFFIIVVHSGGFHELAPGHADMFQASSRWAVPFFFLVSGYFMGTVKLIDMSDKINKLFSILIYSSIIYIPIVYFQNSSGVTGMIYQLFSFSTLRSGTFFHLWFLPSLMLGVIATNYFIKNIPTKMALFICSVIVFAYWLCDIAQSFGLLMNRNEPFYFFRTLISIPLVYVGYLLAFNKISFATRRGYLWLMLFVSFLLTVVEVPVVKLLPYESIANRQFPLFSIVTAVVVLLLCLSYKTKETAMAKAGRGYSLGIYLIHPLVLYFIVPAFKSHGIDSSFLNLISAFVISLFILIFLKNYLPAVYRKMSGIGVS
ncbi:acyltransferase family protein [Enterobacter cloacae]|uniref:acyltransferase family protein n=2 Tax=Enterobacter cloacae complex TaxID=354276 RepID=UPI002FD5A352